MDKSYQFYFSKAKPSNKSNASSELIILLHGLARTHRSFKKAQRFFNQSGFDCLNCHYPSTRLAIQTLAINVIDKALAQLQQGAYQRIHFVTHSMGGILIRYYLSQKSIPRIGRIVMLAPPNHGSQVVDTMGSWPIINRLFYAINGPAGMQLGTQTNGFIDKLNQTPWDSHIDLGIIAVNGSINPILSLLLPRPNDGKVSVESTRLKGMTEHIVLRSNHALMMNNDDVLKKSLQFIKKASFDG